MESNQSISIGILRENKYNWERRAPLNPEHCKQLIESGFKVYINTCTVRCFSDDEYREVGVEVAEDLSSCKIILSVQMPNVSNLFKNTTLFTFSHTTKVTKEGVELLQELLDKNIRLIDYECIRDYSNQAYNFGHRMVSFGKIAGVAGCINLLKGLSEILLSRKISTPLIFTKLSYMYSSLDKALNSLKILGGFISEQRLPKEICPLIFGVVGNGKVSCGVQEALKQMPNIALTPEQLIKGDFEARNDCIYYVVFKLNDIYEKKEKPGVFDADDFLAAPEEYKSIFAEKYLRQLSAIINCLYWRDSYPRILTKREIKQHTIDNDIRLLGISDISCDLNGSIEVLDKYTTFRNPHFIYEPISEEKLDNVDDSTNEGFIYQAIPILASSFAIESSNAFSNMLMKFLGDFARSPYPSLDEEEAEYPIELKKACITANGKLMSRYKNLIKKEQQRENFNLLKKLSDFKYNFFMEVKLKGMLFDQDVFNTLLEKCKDCSQTTNYIQVGENTECESIAYLKLMFKTPQSYKNAISVLESIKNEKVSYSIIKSNLS